ncbi:glycosyltransferase family 4 protein [Arenibacter sp. S6351L]|nr:glycosyltransferase family 4 protein [Arenibacter sp. S6351L]
MAKSLSQSNYKVSVICPLPNYPNGKIATDYKGKIYHKKIDENNISIYRLWIYPSNSENKIKRILSMLSFSFSLALFLFLKIFRGPDIIIVNSPPLFVSFTGVLFSKFILRSKTILNVSDLWPQSAVELGVLKNEGVFYNLLTSIEKFIYRNSVAIIGQSDEILSHIKHFVVRPIFLYKNLPQDLSENFVLDKTMENNKKRIVYAGLLGYAQGILEICKNVNFEAYGFEFHIYGRGMQEEGIKQYIKYNSKSIYFHGEFEKKEAHSILTKYDAALVPLSTHIKGAFPSKIYELIQLEVPILFSGEGDGAELIKEENIGLSSIPGDWTSVNTMLKYFSRMTKDEVDVWKTNQRKLQKNKFNYHKQFESLEIFLNQFN